MAEGREQGFTLIEVVVALAILAGALAVTYRGFGNSWRLERAGTRAAEALHVAETRLAGIGSETPLADGQVFTGEEAGISWQIRVERRATPGESSDAPNRGIPPAYWLILDAQWKDTAARQPQTLRLRALSFGAPSP